LIIKSTPEESLNRISIFHYHLLPGGVTNVILLGAISLIRHYPGLQLLRLICGAEENTDIIKKRVEKEIDATGLIADAFQFEICIEPEISYRSFDERIPSTQIEQFAGDLLRKYGDSFWWIHNYQLGKNPMLTAAVSHISFTYPEQKMLLHIHDFPECARYDNLEKLRTAGISDPYPSGAGTTYSLINGRDSVILKKAGIPAEKVFLLNNPVEDDTTAIPPFTKSTGKSLKNRFFTYYETTFPRVDPEARLLFYPVRTIRRKNALEAGLTAAISEYPVNLILSLPGTSEQERAYSDVCERSFKKGLIPGIWGSGTSDSPEVPGYPQMLQLCDLIVSSSVQEGFGYLFINSVQLGIPLVARDLDILDGIRQFFPPEHCSFYSTLKIPIENNEADRLRRKYFKKLKAVSCYISEAASDKIRAQIERFGADGLLDFSFLPVEEQVSILERVDSAQAFKREIQNINSTLMSNLYNKLESGRYENNCDMDTFSLKKHSETIERIIKYLYENCKFYKTEENIQQNLLDIFAEPEYIRLIYDY
jgi:hypothetical protein